IGGRRYVDGGLWSTSNLDILRNQELDVVICLNPTSSLHPPYAWNPVERIAAVLRRTSGRRLGSERKRLVAAGMEVVLIQPTRTRYAIPGRAGRGARSNGAVDGAPPAGIATQLGRAVTQQVQARIPRADLDERDPDYIRDTLPGMWLLASFYFRADVKGLENIPAEGPVLLVGNHSGGNVTPDTLVFTLAFATYFGVERRFFHLAHHLVPA